MKKDRQNGNKGSAGLAYKIAGIVLAVAGMALFILGPVGLSTGILPLPEPILIAMPIVGVIMVGISNVLRRLGVKADFTQKQREQSTGNIFDTSYAGTYTSKTETTPEASGYVAMNEADEHNICPHCGKPNTDDAKFCRHCGGELTVTCPVCGEKVKDGKFCENCGAKLK